MIKRIFITLAILFITTSCKKNYTCVCRNPSGKFGVFTVNDTKTNASKKCSDYYSQNFGQIPWNETSCDIE